MGRYAPAESKRRATDRVLKGLQERTELLVGTAEKIEEKKVDMEEKKMDRLDQIITKVVGRGHGEESDAVNTSGRSDKLERTVDELKGAVEDMKGATDKTLEILQNK